MCVFSHTFADVVVHLQYQSTVAFDRTVVFTTTAIVNMICITALTFDVVFVH